MPSRYRAIPDPACPGFPVALCWGGNSAAYLFPNSNVRKVRLLTSIPTRTPLTEAAVDRKSNSLLKDSPRRELSDVAFAGFGQGHAGFPTPLSFWTDPAVRAAAPELASLVVERLRTGDTFLANAERQERAAEVAEAAGDEEAAEICRMWAEHFRGRAAGEIEAVVGGGAS